jgi:hypothetical protein
VPPVDDPKDVYALQNNFSIIIANSFTKVKIAAPYLKVKSNIGTAPEVANLSAGSLAIPELGLRSAKQDVPRPLKPRLLS